MQREFVVIPSFLAKWKNLGFDDSDMRRLENELLENPKVGSVMQGTGKVRKMRFAFENRGKSGSVRVIYVDFEVYEKIYLLDTYAKADKDNLTKGEQNNIKAVVELLELSIAENVRR